jgi:histone H3/H4
MVKTNNILIKSKIKEKFLKEKLKINSKGLKILNEKINNFLTDILDKLKYNLELEGRKVVKVKDIEKIFEKENTKESIFEI